MVVDGQSNEYRNVILDLTQGGVLGPFQIVHACCVVLTRKYACIIC